MCAQPAKRRSIRVCLDFFVTFCIKAKSKLCHLKTGTTHTSSLLTNKKFIKTNHFQNFTAQFRSMQKYAVIVAGGTGTRMESSTPKQFLLLHDKPILYYTLKTFLEAYDDLQIILVLPQEYTDLGREIIDAYFDYSRIQIASGGETRFHSVKNGLKQVVKDSIVFVHDAVRCLVTTDLIHRCFENTLETGSAVPAIRSKDSVRLLNEEENDNEVLDRSKVVFVQTPQTFHSRILLPAFEIDYKERFTDEATVVEAFGLKISLVEGEENNIKITRPLDMLVAEKILKEREMVNSK